jgi:voltage-gated potassium channel
MIRLNYRETKNIYHALILLVLIVIIGCVGFMLIEKWSFFDSFYMTIITLSTVGFQEVNQLSDQGRLFTVFLIIASFGTFAYSLAIISSHFASGEYKNRIKQLKIAKSISKMNNHIIVCGYGRVGQQIVKDLKIYKKKIIVVEKNEHAIGILENNHIEFVKGDATIDQVLEKAGIKNASSLILALPKDTDNLFVVLSARELNPQLKIISRASGHESLRKLKIAGASNVIMPDTVGGSHMASLVVNPDLMEFMDLVVVEGESVANIREVEYNQLSASQKNKSVGEFQLDDLKGCIVIGCRNQFGEYTVNPPFDFKLSEDAKLFVLGNLEQINQMTHHLGI